MEIRHQLHLFGGLRQLWDFQGWLLNILANHWEIPKEKEWKRNYFPISRVFVSPFCRLLFLKMGKTISVNGWSSSLKSDHQPLHGEEMLKRAAAASFEAPNRAMKRWWIRGSFPSLGVNLYFPMGFPMFFSPCSYGLPLVYQRESIYSYGLKLLEAQ